MNTRGVPMVDCFTQPKTSGAGTRTLVARVKAECPNQLDYTGFRYLTTNKYITY